MEAKWRKQLKKIYAEIKKAELAVIYVKEHKLPAVEVTSAERNLRHLKDVRNDLELLIDCF